MLRVAIVTGASSGLGRELVRRIDAGEAGHIDEIWAIARRLERLEALRRTSSTPVRPFCLDLTDPSSFEVIEGALAETPGAEVALLVNNAGFGIFGSVASQRTKDGGAMARLLMQAPVELSSTVPSLIYAPVPASSTSRAWRRSFPNRSSPCTRRQSGSSWTSRARSTQNSAAQTST